jgi:exopolysaccharide biosynthesis polyprenyl glycosylphosphotransferase
MGAPIERDVRNATTLPRSVPGKPTPIALQETAAASVRRHMLRDIRRVATLLAADTVTLIGLRVVLRAARDQGLFGSQVAEPLRHLIPGGTLPTAQILLAVMLTLMVLGTYGAGDHRRAAPRIIAGSFIAVALVFWNTLWTSFAPSVLAGYFLSAGTGAVAFVVERWLVDLGVWTVRRSAGNRQRTLVVGPADAARRTARYGTVKRELGLAVTGFIDVDPTPAPDSLGGLDRLVEVINGNRIETIIVNGEIDPGEFRWVVDVGTSAGCRILSVPRSAPGGMIVPEMVSFRGVSLIQLTNPGLTGHQLLVKRVVDVLAASLGLVLMAPVFLIIGVLVKLESPGPVLFRQKRVGIGGREFSIYKFRSMVVNAEDQQENLFDLSEYRDRRLFKVKDDPRVTRLGRFLRRSSLDELPQLINVLRGEMSLVGPRPPLPVEVALYLEHHYARFAMKPGITGPWQVGGRNRITDFDEILLLEQGYMRRWNIFKDVEILVQTVPAVMRMDGAY